jgi:trehalose 6-phosphate phosphatase
MVEGIGFSEIVGNHGLEPWNTTDRLRAEVRRWQPLLEELFSGLQGVKIEDKTFSLAVHYRQSREKKKVRDTVAKASKMLGKMRLVGGKQVINLLPIGAPHKGIALIKERNRLGCDTALYVGDDQTDEDVFSLDQPGQLLSIRVGKKQSSSASFYLKNQQEIDILLQILIHFRRNT